MLARVCALTVALTLAGCASAPREPWVLDSTTLGIHPPRQTAEIDSYPRALAATLEVFTRDLGLPPLPIRLVFLPDQPAFEQLLVEIGYDPLLAREAASQMVAVGGHRHMLLNEERLSIRPWPERLGVLAHELTHALQYELGGGVRGRSEQWLREGYADWVELRVLAALGLADPGEAGRRARAALRRGPGPETLPSLADLATFADWVTRGRGQSGPMLYTMAQAAVAFLIERHGHDAVLRYFRLFGDAQDGPGNFRAAFGEDVGSFERAFRRHVWGTR